MFIDSINKKLKKIDNNNNKNIKTTEEETQQGIKGGISQIKENKDETDKCSANGLGLDDDPEWE